MRNGADKPRFSGKVALVCGAGSGIGRSTAISLASEGAFVFATDVNALAAQQTAVDIGSMALSAELDIVDEAAWESTIQRIVASRGRLDVLVNSAGVSAAAALAELSLAEWRRVMSINLDGAFLGTKHALRAMGTSGGSIVHVSSASGIKGAAGAAAYSTSKAALCMFTKVAAKECRDQGLPIRVNTVCPGGVKTPLWTTMSFFRDMCRELGSDDAAFAELAKTGGPFAEPGDIVAAILFLASDEARFVTGIDLLVDGGFVL